MSGQNSMGLSAYIVDIARSTSVEREKVVADVGSERESCAGERVMTH